MHYDYAGVYTNIQVGSDRRRGLGIILTENTNSLKQRNIVMMLIIEGNFPGVNWSILAWENMKRGCIIIIIESIYML